MYVCLRDSKSTGFPERSKKAIEKIFCEYENIHNQSVDPAEVLALKIKQCVESAREHLNKPTDPHNDPESFESESNEKCWDLNNAKGGKEKPLVIIVFDEAQQLLGLDYQLVPFPGMNAFRYLRRAARVCATDHNCENFFLMFIDTSSRIKDFSPSDMADSSARLVGDKKEKIIGKLFYPYILWQTFDSHFEMQTKSTGEF
jgi:hypothetical protein